MCTTHSLFIVLPSPFIMAPVHIGPLLALKRRALRKKLEVRFKSPAKVEPARGKETAERPQSPMLIFFPLLCDPGSIQRRQSERPSCYEGHYRHCRPPVRTHKFVFITALRLSALTGPLSP